MSEKAGRKLHIGLVIALLIAVICLAIPGIINDFTKKTECGVQTESVTETIPDKTEIFPDDDSGFIFSIVILVLGSALAVVFLIDFKTRKKDPEVPGT